MTAGPPMISAWRRGHVVFARDEAAPNRTPSLFVEHDARCVEGGQGNGVRMTQLRGERRSSGVQVTLPFRPDAFRCSEAVTEQ